MKKVVVVENINIEEKEHPKKCGICGDPHQYKNCKYVVINKKVPDNFVPTRARLSLPTALEIKKLADESYSVFTKEQIDSGTEFGPFVAQKSDTLHPSIIFPIKVFSETNETEYYIETVDENECCWMMFVKPANDVEEQNLICYQEGNDIFFGTIRDLQPLEELKVWYSPYCAFKMQKNTLSFKESSNQLIDFGGSRTETDDLNVLIKEQQKIIPRVVWNCKFCYKLEKNVTDFAKHLLTHYMLHKKTTCELCQKRFRYLTDYKKHVKLLHSNTTEKSDVSKNLPQKLEGVKTPTNNTLMKSQENELGGPLLYQFGIDNSNSLQPPSEDRIFEIETYDNPHAIQSSTLMFDTDNLRLNLDVIESNPLDEEPEKKDHVCDICLRRFATLKSIAMHLRLHIGKYFCSSCKKVFGRQENFKQHKCNQVFSLKCPKCDKIFYQKKYLVKHITVFHDKKYTCLACHKMYYSSTELKNHCCKKNKQDPLVCGSCTKLFNSQRGLRKHVENVHSNSVKVQYICSECTETFASKDIYHRHVMSVHNKLRRFSCGVCDKTFSRSDSLKMHTLNLHSQGPTEFHCPTCKKAFKSKKYLNDHMKDSHSFAKYKCKNCSTVFKYSRNLVRHMRLAHRDDVTSTIEEKHECPICKVKVKLKNSLQRHIKKKHPDRYMTQCIEMNARKDEMKHLRYKCPICQHDVKLKSSLNRHMIKKHPETTKNVTVKPHVTIIDKNKPKSFEEELDDYMDFQKTLENMNFTTDPCNENLFTGSDTMDRFLKESSDQISIFFNDSPRTELVPNMSAERNNREIGLSMPDLSEIDLETKTVKTVHLEAQRTISSVDDVVLYLLNDKGS